MAARALPRRGRLLRDSAKACTSAGSFWGVLGRPVCKSIEAWVSHFQPAPRSLLQS